MRSLPCRQAGLGTLRLEMTLFLAPIFLFQALTYAAESRYAFVSGSFYPSDKTELKAMIDGFLSKVPASQENAGELKILIVPHAGYVYSGQTAAYAYKLLSGKSFDTVVLLGPYHRGIFEGASIWKSDRWETPLGKTVVNEEMARAIAAESALFNFTEDTHTAEHSLEIQLPFLQTVLKDFKIVPILVSDPSPENTQELARAVLKHIEGKNALVVASTDMSHYFEDSAAREMDAHTRELVLREDTQALLRDAKTRKAELCGLAAVITALDIAKLEGNTTVQLLHASNSGDSTGDKSRVVGYGAFAVYRSGPTQTVSETKSHELTQTQGKELLKIARQTIETYVSTGRVIEPNVTDPALQREGASFVTLKKEGNLRGCIGSLTAREPLYLSVRNMAVQSASNDPRFKPVKPEELKDIKVEISLISAPQKVNGANEIGVGKHGVILKNATASGIFLPKVAAETGWSKEQFLSELCSQKAGLPRDCWQDPATELYTFTSQDFSE